MKQIPAKQQFAALLAAMVVTLSIIWTLSSYAYAKPAHGLSPTAKQIAQTRPCS